MIAKAMAMAMANRTVFIDLFRGCTRLADMLPSKYEDNTLQIKEKKYRKNYSVFLCWKLQLVPLPIFWTFNPTPPS